MPPIGRRVGEGRRRAPRRLPEHALVLGGFTVLTIVLTYPIAFRLSTHLPGDNTDTNVFAWNLWWFRKALVDLHASPFWTDYLFYPDGVGLALHSLAPFNALVGLPLQALVGLVASLNLLVLLGFVLSGYGAYLLIRHLVGDRPPAFIGGIIFAFCPYTFAHLLGHLDLTGTQWIPFYALCLIRLVGEDEGRRIGTAAGCAACLLLVALTAYYYLAYALLFTAILLGYRTWIEGRVAFFRRAGGRLATATALFLIGFAPLLAAIGLQIAREWPAAASGGGEAALLQADLAAFVTPSPLHPVWGGLVRPVAARFSGNTAEATVFAGYIPLGLALGAAVRLRAREPWVRFWALALAVFFVLALGPFPRVLGYGVRLIPLPYHLIRATPVLNALRVPSRFAIMVMLCLAVLAAFACRSLLAGLRRRPARAAAFAGIALVVALEYLAVPFPTFAAEAPAIYGRIAREPGVFTVLEVPLGRRSGTRTGPGTFPAPFMYYQTVHGQRTVGGYVSRAPVAALEAMERRPLLRRILALQADRPGDAGSPANERAAAAADLAALAVRYVVLHRPYDRSPVRAFVETVLPVEKVYEEQGVVAFRARDAEGTRGRVTTFRE